MSGMAASTSQSRRSTPSRVSGAARVDFETGLSLVECWRCRDVRLIALTVKNTNNPENLGRRFFKCPRNQKGVPNSCPIYMFQTEYEEFLRKIGMLDMQLCAVGDETVALKWELEDIKKEFFVIKGKVQDANGMQSLVTRVHSQGKIILFLVSMLVVLVLLVILLLLIK